MFFIDAHLTEAQGTDQGTAGRVLHKDAREEFPKPSVFCFPQEPLQREATRPTSAKGAVNIDGTFGNANIAVPRPVRGRRGKGNQLAILLDDHNGMDLIKPASNFL